MKTVLQELIEELEATSKIGQNPYIKTTVNLVIDMLGAKLEEEKQQITNAFVAGEKNIDFPALHGQGTLSSYTKYLEEVYKIGG